MARETPRQRVDAEGFTLVSRGRRKSSAAPEASSAPDYRRYLLAGKQEDTPFLMVRRLEQAHPDLRVRITERREEVFLDPTTEEAAFLLARLCREGNSLGLTLTEVERSVRGVVLRYPLGYSLDPLREHPCVTFARRCVKRTGHGRTEPTRQVEVQFRGSLPNSLNLGLWGSFSVRKFIPEPLRCFKCQGFGHVQKYCLRSELCGVCSQRHPTSECIRTLKAGGRPEACCPNCGGKHHVWSPNCPERLRRLPPRAHGVTRGEQREIPSHTRSPTLPRASVPPAAPPSVPPAPGKKKRRRRRKRAKPAAALPLPQPSLPTPPPQQNTPRPVLADATSQAAAETRDAQVGVTTTVNWCRCDEELVLDRLGRIEKMGRRSKMDAIKILAEQIERVIAPLRQLWQQPLAIAPMCNRRCYSFEELISPENFAMREMVSTEEATDGENEQVEIDSEEECVTDDK